MCCIVIGLLMMACLTSSAQQVSVLNPPAPSPTVAKHASITADYGKLPLSFETNQGQVDPRVRFLSRGNGYSLFLTDKEAVLSLRKPEKGKATTTGLLGVKPEVRERPSYKSDVVRMKLEGANRALHVLGAAKLPGTANYFIGNDPSKWHTSVPTFGKVTYEGVYPGVDLVYYGNQQQLEYDFVVAPGADARLIRIHFEGAKKMMLTSSGDLQITAEDGEIAFHKPVVYQIKDGRKQKIQGEFKLLEEREIAFQLGAYDKTRELVIDPTLAYSSFLAASTEPTAIAADQAGDAYVVGTVSGSGLAVSTGAYQAHNETIAAFDTFITKINPAGTGILYSTYLGGSGTESQGDYPSSIKIDGSGNAYIAGFAASDDFPTKGPIQPTNKGKANGVPNCFVTKLNSTGTGLLYSTYLGGSGVPGHSSDPDSLTTDVSSDGGDGCTSIALDAEDNAYVVGGTFSRDFPLAGSPLQSSNKGFASTLPTAFVAKINPSGSSLLYSTYLGGSGGDSASSVAIDSSGNAYVAGGTSSTDFPAFGKALQTKNMGSPGSGFVAKLNAEGSALDYATYLGGAGGSGLIDGIAVDLSDNAYLYGVTTSSNFPTTNGAFQEKRKPVAIYPWTLTISKLDSAGSSLIYSTYLNSNGGEFSIPSAAMAIDAAGDVYVTGFTLGTDFPTTGNAFQSSNNCAANAFAEPASSEPQTAFITELNASGSAPVYSTYLGGTGTPLDTWLNGQLVLALEACEDEGLGLALDGAGGVYVTGEGSPDFPSTTGTSGTSGTSLQNPFVTKFDLKSSATGGTITTLGSNINPQVAGGSATITAYVQSNSGSGIPKGSVTFDVDGKQAGIETLTKSGSAALSLAKLTQGAHTVKASYGGEGEFNASASSFTQVVFGTAAHIAIASGNKQSTVYGSAFPSPIVILVTDSSGDPIPGAFVSLTGTGVTFSGSGTTSNNGQVSVIATATATGSLLATAALATNSSIFAGVNLSATPAKLTITANNESAHYKHPIPAFSYTATGFALEDTPAVLTGVPIETTTAINGSPGGTYPIDITKGSLKTANYTLSFVDGALTIVQQVTVSTIALKVFPSSAALGSIFTVTAEVTDSTGKPATSGIVSFYDGSFLLGSAAIVASTGTATLKTRSLTPGANVLEATSVLGGSIAATASAPVTVTATGVDGTAVVLSASGTEGGYALTAAVSARGPGIPAGKVTFTDSSTNTTLGTASLSPTNGGITYTTSQNVTLGNSPTQAVLADVNGDGYPDLVGTFYGGSTRTNWISISIGNGDGTFKAPSFVTTNASSNNGGTDVVVVDLNHDGVPDLVASSWAGNGIAVFLGKGNGTFGYETDFPINDSYAVALAVADLNGDGFPDIVTADYFGQTISVLLGKGDGTFQPEATYTAQTNPEAVAIGDLNGDGFPDIAVGNGAGTLSLFFGNGDGTFQPQQLITINSSLDLGNRGLALGDVNGDGKPDLVLTRYSKDEVDILLGNGNGTFQSPYTVNVLAGAAPTGVLIADLNHDGIADLVVSSDTSNSAIVLLGTGGGAFRAYPYTDSSGANALSVADVNGDGLLDLATANSAAGTLSVLLSRGAFAGSISAITLQGAGDDLVSASYSGSTNFAGSTSAPLILKSKGSIAATPTLSPAAGTYNGKQSVLISDKTAGATIRYTIDGSTPTTGSPVYAGPIIVAASETVKAIAIAADLTISAVASATYTIK